jgi:hypothetical protein
MLSGHLGSGLGGPMSRLQVVETEGDTIAPGAGLILERSGEGRGEERAFLADTLPNRRLVVLTSQRRRRLFG